MQIIILMLRAPIKDFYIHKILFLQDLLLNILNVYIRNIVRVNIEKIVLFIKIKLNNK